MFKVFSRVVIVSMLVLGLAAPVLATTTRTIALAETGDYINDDSNIFRWYGVLPSYANLVMAEAGNWQGYGGSLNQALGITHMCGKDGKFGTFGMFLLKNTVQDGSFFEYSPIHFAADGFGDVGLTVPVSKFALSWGKELDAMSVGIMFTRSDVSTEDESFTNVAKMSKSYTTFGGGIRADLGDAAYTDVAITVGLGGYSNEGGLLTAKQELDKKLALDFAGRIFYEWKDNVTLVPMVDYGQYEFALKPGTEPFGSKVKSFMAGVGMNMDVNTNNLLICGAQVNYYKWEYSSAGTAQDAEKIWSLPTFFLALETDVKPWMTTRIGAWKSLNKSTSTSTDPGPPVEGQDYIYTGADFAWFLGLGFHVAEFDIDMLVSEETPFNLGYWLTGYEGYSNGPVSRISATYHF